MNQDRLRTRLLTIFLGELEEQIRAMNADLLRLEIEPGDPQHLKSLFRAAHTLKGAAAAAGVPLIQDVCHAMETLLGQAREGKTVLGRDEFVLLYSTVDALQHAGERLKAGGGLDDSLLSALARSLEAPGQRTRASGRLRVPPPRTAPSPPEPTAARTAAEMAAAEPSEPAPMAGADAAPEGGVAAAEPAESQYVRIEAEKLNTLFASVGQLQIAAAPVIGRPRELGELHAAATRTAAEWQGVRRRLRVALRAANVPASLLLALERVEDSQHQLAVETSRLAAGVLKDARTIERLTDEVGQGVLQLRLRPFADACESLPRVVRDVATAVGKEARFELHGGDVQADRAVLRGISEALLHLVRNAVDHGVEPPEIREAAGKPRVGAVAVSALLRGDRLVVTVSDDGAGLDLPTIRTLLERRGIPAPAEERELLRLLFEGGVSTRAEATEISGRGVGLDVVRDAIERVQGSVEVVSTPGQGARFVLECPLTLATSRVLLLRLGTQVMALPTAAVERLTRVKPEDIRRAEGRDVVTTEEGPIPLVALARLLGLPPAAKPANGPVPVIRLLAGGRRLAVTADELLGEQEVIVRPVARLRTPLAYLGGAAILGTGTVVLVLNPIGVVTAAFEASPATISLARPEAAAPSRRRILVVDDSISTRTLEQSILEAAGYEVITAVDGADAWRILQERGADLVVSDVEMPRMDGFALCDAIRASKRFASLPVVLVTALETAEHRARGLEAGADAYIAKSSFDQENLLDTVRQLIG